MWGGWEGNCVLARLPCQQSIRLGADLGKARLFQAPRDAFELTLMRIMIS